MPAEDTAPDRMSLTNLVTGETMGAQYNPEELSETIGAAYSGQVVPGLSHTAKQFSNTEDLAVNFTLYFTSFDGVETHRQNMWARNFLHACCHPRTQNVGGLGKAGPPRVLFLWPELYAITCVIRKVAFSFKQFRLRGAPVRFTAAVSLEEIRDALIGMEDVLEVGTERSAGRVDGTRYGGEF